MAIAVTLLQVNYHGTTVWIFVQSDTGHIQAFKNKLESKKIHVTIRREMGRDIDGACGQLRRRHTQEMQNPDGLSQEEN